MYFYLFLLSLSVCLFSTVHISHCPPCPSFSLSLSLTHRKTVRRVYRQRSHVSPRIAQCVAVFVYLCVRRGCTVGVHVCGHASAGAPSVPLHFLIRYRIPERRPSPCGTVEIPFLWINPAPFPLSFSLSLSLSLSSSCPLPLPLLSHHTHHNYSTRQLPSILLGCTFCSLNLVS